MLSALLFASSGAGAQDANEAYWVRDIAIDATAESALAAKRTAIVRGQRQALDRLLRRLTLAADHPRLPAVGELNPADFLASYAVDDEKTSDVRYLARLTVQFQRPAVQRLLRGNGVSFSEARARPTLILPVFEQDNRRQLFAEDNPWLVAWSDLALPFGALLPMTVPLGDLGDLSALDAEAALAPDGLERFAPLLSKYDSASVAVMHATVPAGAAAAGADAAPARINVAVYRYGPAGEGTIVTGYKATADESLPALLQRAARDVADQMVEDWKRRTVLRFGDEASLSARVSYAGLDGWLEIRRRLTAVPNIEAVEISAISTIDAQITLHYLGEANQLNAALAAHDLKLEDRQGYWHLLRTDLKPAPEAAADPAAAATSAPIAGSTPPALTDPATGPASGAATGPATVPSGKTSE